MTKTVVITQSNYLPWRGYFDMFRLADEIVLLESVQYTRRDWRNRNRIKTSQGLEWLTIPVEVKGRYLQAIDETRIVGTDWVKKHVKSIELAYRNAPAYDEVAPWLFGVIESVSTEPLLSRVNEITLSALCHRLGIGTRLRRCSQIIAREKITGWRQRTVSWHWRTRWAQTAISRAPRHGPISMLTGFRLWALKYNGCLMTVMRAIRRGLWGPFEPAVSIIDLFLNAGSDAPRYLLRS